MKIVIVNIHPHSILQMLNKSFFLTNDFTIEKKYVNKTELQ